jgi:hypothetical protein
MKRLEDDKDWIFSEEKLFHDIWKDLLDYEKLQSIFNSLFIQVSWDDCIKIIIEFQTS